MSGLQREFFRRHATLPPLPPMQDLLEGEDDDSSFSSPAPTVFREGSRKKDYTATTWEAYFDSMQDVVIPETRDTFRAYYTRAADPLAPLFILHHGAGHSGLSFGLVAGNLKRIAGDKYSILSIDCRGHGYTITSNDGDLSLGTLSQDLVNVTKAVFGEEMSDVLLVGHSMGGSVVTEVAHKRMLPNILGLAVLDVVEGTAMEVLSSMRSYLLTRPHEFNSMELAIKWSVRSRTIRNLESAKLSIPPLLRENEHGKFVWRIDLTKTETYWTEWFSGLSEKFLSVRAAKLLILAGTERLDKPLTIAQMQGKYQLQVYNESGHAVQEDEPERMALQLVDFSTRNQRLVLPTRII